MKVSELAFVPLVVLGTEALSETRVTFDFPPHIHPEVHFCESMLVSECFASGTLVGSLIRFKLSERDRFPFKFPSDPSDYPTGGFLEPHF
jgi:hypothetical protein